MLDPGTLWLSTYHGGKSSSEARVGPPEVSELLGRDASLSEEYHTYTIDWQPGHVTW